MKREKPFTGISKNTEKAIEDALSEALSDDETNPTSRKNNLKGRNKVRKTRAQRQMDKGVEKFALGGEVRFNPSRGKTY